MIPVVLSGGSGTRLWPVSRQRFPKQFNELVGEALLIRTLKRLRGWGSPWVVAVAGTEDLTRMATRDLQIPPEQVVFEPEGRNTAAAVGLLCTLLQRRGLGREVLGVFPADHLIQDEDRFAAAVALAARVAAQGPVVTLGIAPTEPATGYGYIELSDQVVARSADGRLEARATRAFHEKPDAATAARFLEAGRFLWNAGIFVFRADVMAGHLERLQPALWQALAELAPDLSDLNQVYRGLPAVSLDHAVMEHLEQQVTIPCDCGWSDLGSWDEVARLSGDRAALFQEDGAGNFAFGHRDKVYGFVGVDDVILVDTADAVLVTRRGASQSVKGLVDQLRRAGHRTATEHIFERRPWGEFEVLCSAPHFKAKILRVAPGQRLSYQSHRCRSEHWVVVQGHPEVLLEDRVLTPAPGEAVFIPQGAKHRIRNPTTEPVELVEVQTGSYFGEDDIQRFEDDYQRV
jgi:mannose-1-phosphate guanylyltransferase/mannose-1-phosphate guanylyltransferase/mannose-6-phosphate isomerase